MNDIQALAASLLQTPLSLSSDELKTACVALDALRHDILVARVQAQKELAEKREQMRHPKDKELTDFDRRTMLEGAVADYVSRYELLSGLEELVADRLDLARQLIT